MNKSTNRFKSLVALSSVAILTVSVAVTGGMAAHAAGTYKIGVSNSWAGNAWREEMVCAIKAEATLSHKVASVLVASRNTDAAGQSSDIKGLADQGVNAIIVNSGDTVQNNVAIKYAQDKGVKVVAVDNSVTAPNTTFVANDQVKYGAVGAEALAKAMNYKGNVLYMRGASGAGADTDRDTGFKAVMAKYPKIKIAKEVFTGWDWAKGGELANQLLVPGKFQGVWTSGIDYPVVNAMKTRLKGKYIPLVGADNNEFVRQTIELASKGFVGIVVANPAVVGGYALRVALDLLDGKSVAPKNLLNPAAWTMKSNAMAIKSHYYKDQEPTFSSSTSIPGKTTFKVAELFRCRSPQDSPETTG